MKFFLSSFITITQPKKVLQQTNLLFIIVFLIMEAGVASSSMETTTMEDSLLATMDTINTELSNVGVDYRVSKAEYYTNDVNNLGRTVYAKDVGNKRSDHHFVPCDPRRVWGDHDIDCGNIITYVIDQSMDSIPLYGGLSKEEATAAIVSAHETVNDVQCSSMTLDRSDDYEMDVGLLSYIYGLGGSPNVIADVQHAGFRDIDFVDGILGASFTFWFIDDNGNFTDIDNNGRFDSAFSEIYYDPSWSWTNDGVNDYDVETVALHELLHGLSQEHFGSVVVVDGKLQGTPLAVMNELYTGPLREMQGTDKGGFCNNWANWRNN